MYAPTGAVNSNQSTSIRMKDFNPSIKTQPKQSSKPAKSKFRAPLLAIAQTLVTLLVIAMIIYSFSRFPSYFKQPVQTDLIAVSGTNLLRPSSVVAFLSIPKNTPWLDIDAFELSSLLSTHPWIEYGVVHRRPNLGLDIFVVELQPISYFRTKSDLFLLSREGRVLPFVQSGKTWDLPVIVNYSSVTYKPGDILPKALLAKPFELIALLEENPTLPLKAVSEIDISDPLNIQLVTIPNAIRIKLGVSDFAEKLNNLREALPYLDREKNNLRYLDLRYQRSVVFRRRA